MADITDGAGKSKSGKRAARDAAFFLGGFAAGAAATVAVGYLTDSIDTSKLHLGAASAPTTPAAK